MKESPVSGYQTYIRIGIILFCTLLVLLFSRAGDYINHGVENIYRTAAGQASPDTNIVIIHVSSEDIESVGPLPLKRSYYALLLNRLNSLDVKSVGLEVFLSEKLTSQSVYNELLNNEIKNSRSVVLSSLIEDYDEEKNTGKPVLPEPAHTLTGIPTGHLNFIEENGIILPTEVKVKNGYEVSFAIAMARSYHIYERPIPEKIKLNFFSSWRKFRNYSLLEFINLYESGSSELKSFKGKSVIIGVSDAQAARTVPAVFDDALPGVALHAFALDNILNDRYIHTGCMPVTSVFVLLLLSLLLLPIKGRRRYMYPAVFALFLILSFIFYAYFYVQFHFVLFLFPFTFLALSELLLFYTERRSELAGARSEAEILRKELAGKESKLELLQKELDVKSGENPEELVEKIAALKKDIEALRERQADDIPAEQPEGDNAENFHGIIYRSRAMAKVTGLIKKTAPEDATVLILGESGTGKELVARAMHILNRRRDNNFVAVNCAALSDTLLESELFGHVKGAFTNAVADKTGRFEAADKGTIFLDEIGETSENFQVKLLRILQTGEFEKVGSSRTIHADVRVIAATNRNLEQLVREKKFREDLYYRLNVIRIELPPLRERKEDIEIIVSHFLKQEGNGMTISRAALMQLVSYDWKGNVRELESVIKRAVIFARSADRQIIKLPDLPPELLSRGRMNTETLIMETLREKGFSHSSITEAARELELSRTVVSENFRGYSFRTFCGNGFDREKTISCIAGTDDAQVLQKAASKLDTFLSNVEEDVKNSGLSSFDEVRSVLASKYKNLPQKYHASLDEIIRYFLRNK